jgi:parvulin-like peptidyl-prolyl isomerase
MGNLPPYLCLEGPQLVTRTSRRLALCAAAGLAVLTLSGCGDSPVRTGAAATVGDVRIPTTELEQLVTRGLADPQAQQQLGADKPKFQRQTLSRLINHVVLTEAAKEKGVVIPPAAVDAKIAEFEQAAGGAAQLVQSAAQNGIAKEDLNRFVTDIVLNDALADKLTADIEVPQGQLQQLFASKAAENDQVHAAHILVPTKQSADKILAQVKADPSTFAALAAEFSTDTSNKGKGGDLGFAGRGQFVKPFEDAVFGAKAGDVLVVQTEFGFHVVSILERRTTTFAQALPNLRRAALDEERQKRTTELLSDVSQRMGVKVNPRFGRWNPEEGSVDEVPNGSDVSSPAPGEGTEEGTGDGAPVDGGQPPAEQAPAGQ